jgi:hypothetical protein
LVHESLIIDNTLQWNTCHFELSYASNSKNNKKEEDFDLSGILSSTMCAREASADGAWADSGR